VGTAGAISPIPRIAVSDTRSPTAPTAGPRYTIVKDVPYDRPSTTMASFTMRPECQAEYEDPRNRRFHAQPNACPVCGPQLSLAKSGEATSRRIADLTPVRDLLRQGQIVAVKGLGGFLLACDATNEGTLAEIIVDVVLRIREREGLSRVCLSGGTFQNHLLLERAVRGLRDRGLEVFLHASVPPNDGGISLGQAAIAKRDRAKGKFTKLESPRRN